MTALTKKQVLREFEHATDEQYFCAYCYNTLKKTKEGTLYCPNEMCYNDKTYSSEGIEISD